MEYFTRFKFSCLECQKEHYTKDVKWEPPDDYRSEDEDEDEGSSKYAAWNAHKADRKRKAFGLIVEDLSTTEAEAGEEGPVGFQSTDKDPEEKETSEDKKEGKEPEPNIFSSEDLKHYEEVSCGGKSCSSIFRVNEEKHAWWQWKEEQEEQVADSLPDPDELITSPVPELEYVEPIRVLRLEPEDYAKITFYVPEPEEPPVAEDADESSEEEAPEPPEPVSAASEDDDGS